MILVVGGLGFIGTHVTRALLDRGESCALVQRRDPAVPGLLADATEGRLVIERADVTDLAALTAIGDRHPINGIVHLAGGGIGPEPLTDARVNVTSLLNVIEAGRAWGVRRIGVASTIGVYGGGDDNPLREDLPLPMTASHPIPAAKKVSELLASYLAGATGMEIYTTRISAAWGPLGRSASRFFAVPQMMHAAARGDTLDNAGYAEDGVDMIYVRDCGRAIAALHLAERLNHLTYNVASGRPTTYRDVLGAIHAVRPNAHIGLIHGRDPNGMGRDFYLDVTRLTEDTGYRPAFDLPTATADYVSWLADGNER